ncbi:2'-5' RNA ligase family protein [Methylibium rhizosphaerae]|uniref:2'-5' RNA ligase family protein n=1 Tax=Methylibium rhizosphaerae TaxID=2570323 RepID=UPI0011265A4A|nr:2'-5' RNA ligase family protein [Methylibium rhizosphaerae]
MAQSALVVRVPEAEPWVHALREQFDPSAKQGVPAHITVLHPFMSPELVSERVLAGIRHTLSQMVSFDFQLSKIGRFPGVAYLAPEPATPFIALTNCLAECFPEYPPYGGQHQGVVPHLTVAHGSPEQAGKAEAELLLELKTRGGIRGACREVVLLENSSGLWREMYAFGLSPGNHVG